MPDHLNDENRGRKHISSPPDIDVYKSIVDEKFHHLKESIDKFHEKQDKIIDNLNNSTIITTLLTHRVSETEKGIHSINEKVSSASKSVLNLESKMTHYDSGSNKLFDVIKLLIAAILGGLVASWRALFTNT